MSSIDLWYTTRATGLVALVLLTATVFLGVLTAGRARTTLPAFARAEVHRRVSVLAVVFLAVHVLTAVLDTYVNIGRLAIVVPFTSSYHTFWLALGTIGADLLLAVAISSALRRHIPARTWRALHWLAYLSWPVAVSHALGMGTDRSSPGRSAWWRCASPASSPPPPGGWRARCGRRPPCPRRSPVPAVHPFTHRRATPGIGGRP